MTVATKRDALRLPAGTALTVVDCFRPERIGERSVVAKRVGTDLILERDGRQFYMNLGQEFAVHGTRDGFAYGPADARGGVIVYRVDTEGSSSK